MKKIAILIFICFPGFYTFVIGQTDSFQNNLGFSIGYIPPLSHGIYFDDPWDFWPNREPSLMLQASYARQLNPSFRTGIYFDYEKIRFTDDLSDEIRIFKRYNFGADWIGQYPYTPLHMQLGGYMGYGFVMAQGWDNLHGFDFGMIAGPAYEKGHIGISTQVRSGFAWYSSSGVPEGVMLFNPKILFKAYFRF